MPQRRTTRPRRLKTPADLPLGLMLCAFLLALWGVSLRAQNPGLMADDSGEMVAASAVLGIPHPPGYPLFTLLGRLALLVPLGSPAFRMNLLSGFFVILACALLGILAFRLLGNWGLRGGLITAVLSAGVPAAVFSSTNVFAQGLTAKGGVYTSTLLLLTALLFLQERALATPKRPGPSVMAALFLWALGMANHWPTTLLWVPFLASWSASWWRGGVRRAVVAVSFAVVGLSVYLVLPLRAGQFPALDWGHPAGIREFLWVVTRRLSAGTEPWIRPLADYLAHGSETLRVLAMDPWPGWIVLAILGILLLGRLRPSMALAWILAALLVPVAVVVVPRPETTYLLNVYLVCCAAPLSLFALAGSLRLLPGAKGPFSGLRILLAAAFLLAPLLWSTRVFRQEDRSRYLLQEDYGINLLKMMPNNAFLLAEGDVNVFPAWYHRLVRGFRADVGMTPFVFLNHDWGWSDVGRQRPDWVRRRPDNILDRLGLLRAMAYEEQESRPFPGGQVLFYTPDTTYLDALVPGFRGILRPFGLLHAVTARDPGARFASDLVETQEGLIRRRGVVSAGEFPAGDVMSREILRRYSDAQVRVADLVYRSGNSGRALFHFDRAVRLYPLDARVYGNMAVIIGQDGWWELARLVAEEGAKAVPDSALLQMNLGNACLLTGDHDGAFSAYANALRLRPGWKEAQDQLEAVLRFKQGGFASLPSERNPEEFIRLAADFRARGCLYLSGLAGRLGDEAGKGRGTP